MKQRPTRKRKDPASRSHPTSRPRTSRPQASQPTLRRSHVVGLNVAVFAIGSLAFGLYVVHVGQESDYDLLNYHYYIPYAFLEQRLDYDYAPAQLQTYLNPLAFVPLYWLTQHVKPVLVGLIHGSFHGLTFGLLFALAFRVLHRIGLRQRVVLALLAAACGVYGPVFMAVVGSSSSDALLNPVVLLGVYLIVVLQRSEHGPAHTNPSRLAPANAISSPSRSRSLALLVPAGLALGFAGGLKLVEVLYAVAAACGLLLAGGAWRARWRAATALTVASLAGFLLARGFWMYTLWEKFQSPFFPFFNRVFNSPYYESTNLADRNFLPNSLAEHVLYPFHFITQTAITDATHEFRDSRYAVIYVLLVLVVLTRVAHRWKLSSALRTSAPDRAELFLIGFFVAGYLLWQAQFSILRYAITLESLSGIVIVILIRRIVSHRTAQTVAFAAVVGVIALSMRPCKFPRSAWAEDFLPVDVPTFDNPKDVLVVIAHNRPLSFLVPYFQPEVRFVAVKNNLTKPEKPNRFQAEVRSVIRDHPGHVLLLGLPEDLGEDAETLRMFDPNLAVADTSFIRISTPAYESGLGLWLLKQGGL